MSGPGGRIGRLEAKLERYLEAGKYYEAEQMYQTLCSRYCAQGKFEAAAELAIFGAKRLLAVAAHHQVSIGAKLAMELIHVYQASRKPVEPTMIDAIVEVFNAFPSEAVINKSAFMKKAIKWSTSEGSHKFGGPKLNYHFAKFYSSVNDFGNAAKHYLHSEAYAEHAKFLVEWANNGYESEQDLFIVRTVLQYLCFQNVDGAENVVEAYITALPSSVSPLVNFARFLIQCVRRRSVALFRMLRSKYEPSILRDEEFTTYVDRIGKVFFDLKPVGGGMSGLFGEVMEMLGDPVSV